MKFYISIWCLGLIVYNLNAQNKIEGYFNSKLQCFETEDSSYWIGWFNNGLAKISRNGYLGLIDNEGVIICAPKYDRIFDFKDGIAVVTRNDKYGIIDITGEEILAPSLPFISDFSLGIAWFLGNDKKHWGLLNDQGKIIRPAECIGVPKFHKGDLYWSNNSKAIVSKSGHDIYILDFPSFTGARGERTYFLENDQFIRQGKVRSFFNKYRLPAENGTSILEPVPVDLLFYFKEGLAMVPENIAGIVKIGYIDSIGKIVIPCKYDNAQHFIDNQACVKKDGRWGVINRLEETIIPFQYEYLEGSKSNFFIFVERGLFGVMTKEEEIVLPAEYLKIKHLFGSVFGLLKENQELDKLWESIEKDNPYFSEMATWGVVDVETKDVLLSFRYYDVNMVNHAFGFGIKYFFEDVVPRKNLGLDQPVINPFTTSTLPLKEMTGLAITQVFDFTGRLEEFHSDLVFFIAPYPNDDHIRQIPIYTQVEECYYFSGSYLNSKGHEIKETAIIEYLNKRRNSQRIIVFNDQTTGNQGVKNLEHKVILPPIYQKTDPTSTGIIVCKDEHYGFMDLRGFLVLPIIYERMEMTESGVLSVTLKNETYLIDKIGKRIN